MATVASDGSSEAQRAPLLGADASSPHVSWRDPRRHPLARLSAFALTALALLAVASRVAPSSASLGDAPSSDSDCKILYYYHIPKTGGGSVVRYFGHHPDVELLRYESTRFVTPDNSTLYHWEHESSADHWEKYIVPHALRPGRHFIAHHWGRFGMLQMKRRLERLRSAAEARGCAFMTSTTFRDPVDRDVSDTIFKRILGVSTKNYIGDEQLRFFLINSERANARVPKNLAAHGDARRDAMRNATTLLRDAIDVVATIDELETQKNAFLNFFDLPVGHGEARDKYLGVRDANLGDARAASEEREGEREGQAEEDETTLGKGKWENESTAAGQPLGHVHKIDYAEQGVDEREMRRLRRKFARTNALDTRLYALARALSVESPQLGHARTQKGVLEAIDAAKTKSEAGKKQTSERRGDAKDAREGRGTRARDEKASSNMK